MRRPRAAFAGAATIAGLAVANPALGALTPRFVVNHNPHNPAAATTQIKLAVGQQDDAIAKVTFFVPLGYQGVLGQAAGTQIGTAQTHIIAQAVSQTTVLPVNGTIVADDPTKYAMIPTRISLEAFACTGTPQQHDAVWLLNLAAAGRQLEVPVYLDAVESGPEASFARFVVQACLRSPDVPESQGGAPLGTKLIDATLNLNRVFTPTASGQYVWPALFTPFQPGMGIHNPAGTVQARAIVRVPRQVTLRSSSRRVLQALLGTATVTGSVTENRVGIAGAVVELLAGNRRLARTRTRSNGSYSVTLRRSGAPRATVVRARATVPERSFPAGCNIPIPGVPTNVQPRCVTATLSGFTTISNGVRVRF